MTRKLKNKLLLLFCVFTVLSLACAINSYAATKKKKKINNVTVRIEGNIEYDTKIGQENIEIREGGSNYSVDSYTADNEGFKWTLEDTPKFTITLTAEEGYSFNISKSSQVNVIGGTYVTASNPDSRTLVLKVKLPSLRTQVYPISNASLDTQGNLTWTEAVGAGSYEVRFMRGNTILDGVRTTTATSMNLSEYMTKAGTYSFKVRPINKNDTSVVGLWAESNVVSVGTEEAKAFALANEKRESDGKWVQDSIGYYFVLADGSLVNNTWKKINGEWYYFEDNGYMATGWKEVAGKWYYLDPTNGNMWKNTKTPDGYTLGIDGVRATR